MADAAAAVLARLKNKANESGRTYQLCLQLFCQEEFLRRLEKSKYVDNLVLKGGLFIYAITDFDSRVTMDVDFLLWKVPNTPEQLKTVLEEIITVPAGNDFVTYEKYLELPAVREFIHVLKGEAFKERLDMLGGYSCEECGQICFI